MKCLSLSIVQLLIPHDDLTLLQNSLESETKRIKEAITKKEYRSVYALFELPFDGAIKQAVQELALRKKQLQPSLLIIIGIGGSNSGTMAIQQALHGLLYNAQNDMKVYFADSLDTLFTQSLYAIAEGQLKQNKEVLLVVVSKSGTTTETIANLQLYATLLMHYKKNYKESLVIISDEGSPLITIARQNGIDYLIIPTMVGGRFSVFSPVGLFPLAMLNIDIHALQKGAALAIELAVKTSENIASKSASLLFALYGKGYIMHDSFFFDSQLEAVGTWYRQLMGESIGKAVEQNDHIVRIGITPTVSIGSTDLHSVGQLYLAGPHNRVTTFISSRYKSKSSCFVPKNTVFSSLSPMISGKTYSEIMEAILKGTQQAYQKQNLPFMAIELPEISAYYIGQLLQWKMLEIVYLGALFRINPFNQPQVELYKEETRKILAHE